MLVLEELLISLRYYYFECAQNLQVGVGGKVDEAQVNDELGDLHDGDVLLPPDTDTSGCLEVVPVHDDVYGEVESDGNP